MPAPKPAAACARLTGLRQGVCRFEDGSSLPLPKTATWRELEPQEAFGGRRAWELCLGVRRFAVVEGEPRCFVEAALESLG